MAADPDCIFCKIIAGEIPCFKLYDDDATLAFMDINPANNGHALIIPKEHSADVHAVVNGGFAIRNRELTDELQGAVIDRQNLDCP